MNNEQTVDNLKLPPNNKSVDYANMTDNDLKHLVIYYATIVRNPKNQTSEMSKQVFAAWDSWPKEFRERFYKMIWDECQDPKRKSGETFWSRPADNNIRYGI